MQFCMPLRKIIQASSGCSWCRLPRRGEMIAVARMDHADGLHLTKARQTIRILLDFKFFRRSGIDVLGALHESSSLRWGYFLGQGSKSGKSGRGPMSWLG